MKLLSLICIFTLCVVQCHSFMEFGRDASLEDDLNIEMAWRELSEMSMSMSMSFSYSYDDSGDDEASGGSGSGSSPTSTTNPASPSNPTSPSSGGGSPTTSPATTPTTTPVSTPTLSPDSTSAPVPTTGTTPTATPVSGPTTPPTLFPTEEELPSCSGLEMTPLQHALNIETPQTSISFNVLENVLTDAMRDVLPFCEDVSERRLFDSTNTTGDYYIGNVDIEQAADAATCTPEIEGVNCIVGQLTLKLFGDVSEGTVVYILEVVEDLLKSDNMGEVLGNENPDGLIDDLNSNSTDSDADQDGKDQLGREASQGMPAGRKALISILCLVAVAFIAIVTFRHYNRPTNPPLSDGDGDESDSSDQRPMAITADNGMYGV